MYSLKDIIVLTNLSERTIRRYISEGKLEGTKVGGVWRFTEEQLDNFYGFKEAIKTIKREIGMEVTDFINMPNPKKKQTHTCLMIDLNIDEELMEKVKYAILDECNKHTDMKMKFYTDKDNYRVLLIGSLDFITSTSIIVQNIIKN